jgi:hypothetical protein
MAIKTAEELSSSAYRQERREHRITLQNMKIVELPLKIQALSYSGAT